MEKTTSRCILLLGIVAAFVEPSRKDTANVTYSARSETAFTSVALQCGERAVRQTLGPYLASHE